MLRYEIAQRPVYVEAVKVTRLLPQADALSLSPFDRTAAQHLAHQQNLRPVLLENDTQVDVDVTVGPEVKVGDHVYYDVGIDNFRVFTEDLLAGKNYKLIIKD